MANKKNRSGSAQNENSKMQDQSMSHMKNDNSESSQKQGKKKQ